MESHFGTPSSSHRGEWASNGSDGATRSDSSSPLGTFASYTQPTYTTTPAFPTLQYAGGPNSSGFSTGEKGHQQLQKEPLATADWDPRTFVPLPLDTLINRLNIAAQLTAIQPKMKTVNEMAKIFKPRYAARENDDWAHHLDLLETDVFQKEDFKPKQVYYSIKVTIFGEPERCLRRLEIGTEKPNLRTFIPTWYKPKEEDWKALYLQWPFSQLSFALRSGCGCFVGDDGNTTYAPYWVQRVWGALVVVVVVVVVEVVVGVVVDVISVSDVVDEVVEVVVVAGTVVSYTVQDTAGATSTVDR